jgi:nicotinamidase/pyrazinamidase
MKTVFVDIDTQLDFLYPAGALYVPGAERVISAIAHLNRHAAARGIPVLSTADAHAENDPEFQHWPPHCIAGALGRQKAAATLLEKRIVVPNSDAGVAIAGAPQIILEKQTIDVFETRTLRRVLDALGADRFVLYGVVTEVCIVYAARGLLKAGKSVVVVEDAIKELRSEDAACALDEIRSLGGTVSSLAQVCGGD